jgi:hypothetical protein
MSNKKMSRLDMIAVLRQRPAVDARIDLFKCNEDQITRIFAMSERWNKQQVNLGLEDYEYLENLYQSQLTGAVPVGRRV